MKYLLVAPDIGFTPSRSISPGGLGNFGRSLARALASSPSIEQLGIWSQVDKPITESMIERMVKVHAHPSLQVDVRCFGGSRARLASAVAWPCLRKHYHCVFYLLVNQVILSALPWHLPYAVWEIGRELFQPISRWKYRALSNAHTLLSISQSTSDFARQNNPGLPHAQVVPLCLEPPFFEPPPTNDPVATIPYEPANRKPSVFILSRIAMASLDKGHQELIAAWPKVVEKCPEAELWIGGAGDGQAILKRQVAALPAHVFRQIHFLGYPDGKPLESLKSCRWN